MADMQFELVSPERSLASATVTSVQVPGAEGDMTAMADHAPTITTLRPGILTAQGADGAQDYVVSGGFAQIGGEGVTILAEQAMARADVTQDFLNGLRSAVETSMETANDTTKDALAKTLADIDLMGNELGLTN